MNQIDQPIFPLKVIYLCDDPMTVEEYDDLESIIHNLEFYCSESPEELPGSLVLDRENRPVRLVVDMTAPSGVKCFELYSTTPLTQEEIAEMHRKVLQALREEEMEREKWRKEREEKSLLRRIIRWFKR